MSSKDTKPKYDAGWRKWSGRFSYVNDYRKNDKGEYEYCGARYRWLASEKEQRRLRVRLRVISILPPVMAVVAGCIPAPGMDHRAYLLLPYAAGLIACLCTVPPAQRVCAEPDPMRDRVYQKSVMAMPPRAYLSTIFAAFCCVAEACHLVIVGHAGWPWGLLFIALEGAQIPLLWWTKKKMAAGNWEKV